MSIYSMDKFINDKHFKCNCCQPKLVQNCKRRIKVLQYAMCDASKEKYGMLFYDIDNDMLCFQKKSGCVVSLCYTTQNMCNEPCYNHPIREIIKEVRKEVIVEKGRDGRDGKDCICSNLNLSEFVKMSDINNLPQLVSNEISNKLNSNSQTFNDTTPSVQPNSYQPSTITKTSYSQQQFLSNIQSSSNNPQLLLSNIQPSSSNLQTSQQQIQQSIPLSSAPSISQNKSILITKPNMNICLSNDESTPVCPPCHSEHSENDNFLDDQFLKECVDICNKFDPEMKNKVNMNNEMILFKNEWLPETVYSENNIVREDDNRIYLCKKQHLSKNVNRPINDKRSVFWDTFSGGDKVNVMCQLILNDVTCIKINPGINSFLCDRFVFPFKLKNNVDITYFDSDVKSCKLNILRSGNYRITYNVAYQGDFSSLKTLVILSETKELKHSIHKNICESDDINYINHTFVLTLENEASIEFVGYLQNKTTPININSNLNIQADSTWVCIERMA